MAEALKEYCQPGETLLREGTENGRRAGTVWFHVRDEKDLHGDRSASRIGFENIADRARVLYLIRSIRMGSA